ncbi:MAG: 3-dehydroquinate synthase, partial [Gemmatimonadetes bacterium]|nr:3-dehydroquinate synthase [Gemmatimonadota bacterium]
GLPVGRPAALAADAVLEATRRDKKAAGGAVAYALPAGLGAMAGAERGWRIEVGDSLVREVLA